MKSLYDARLVKKVPKFGVKVIGNDKVLTEGLRLEVTEVSQGAKASVVAAGGKATTVYYNRLGLRALLRPDKYEKKGRALPRPAKPPPRLRERFDVVPDRIHDGPIREPRPAYPPPTELQMERHTKVESLNQRIATMRAERFEREAKAKADKLAAKEDRRRQRSNH